jgi:hypothetical protein
VLQRLAVLGIHCVPLLLAVLVLLPPGIQPEC